MAGLFTPISPATARLQTLINRHCRNAILTTAGTAWALRPTWADLFEGPTLHGTLGDSPVTVWLGDPEWRLIVADVLDLPAEAAASCPEPILRAALESVAGEVLAAVEKATGLSAVVKDLELTPTRPVGQVVRFDMANVKGQLLRLTVLFAKPEGQWAGALEKCLLALPAETWALPDDLPIPARVCLAGTRLTRAELAGLAFGDVVLFPGGSAWTLEVAGQRRFAVRNDRGILRVEGKVMTGAELPADARTEGETMADIESIEMEVTAQVGKISLTLAQLRQLGAGQVVEFPTSVETPARLTVGGKTFAVGELVDVGGRVGVRIIGMGSETGA